MSIQLLFKLAKDSLWMYTEFRSYLCGAAEETDPTSIDISQLQKTRASGGTYAWKRSTLSAWNNLSETFAEALMERLDQHRSKVLWNDTGDLEASRGAYKALVPSRLRISPLFATCFRRTISSATWRETTATRNWTNGVGCDYPLCVLWKQKPNEKDVLCGNQAVRPLC